MAEFVKVSASSRTLRPVLPNEEFSLEPSASFAPEPSHNLDEALMAKLRKSMAIENVRKVTKPPPEASKFGKETTSFRNRKLRNAEVER
jgi:hypothetical protein